MIDGIEVQSGSVVVATQQIVEWLKPVVPTVHARKGDRGTILDRELVADGVEQLTVLFTRSGTVMGVFAGPGGNVKLIERERTSTPAERADTAARAARAASHA